MEQTVDQEDLRSDIIKDIKGESPEGKKPWEIRLEQDHPNLKKEPEEEVKEIPPEETQKESTSEQPAEEESQPAEEQPEAPEAKPEAKKDTAEDAYIAEYAKRKGLEPEAAKERVEKLRAIANKYGNDPVKLAEAYQETQSAYDKQKVTASSNVNPAVAQIAANPRLFAAGEVKANPKWIEEYRAENPARSRDMDDEQVVEALVEFRSSLLKNRIGEFEVKLKREAVSKREDYVKGMAEADRKFLPEIKPVLDQLPDHQIMSDTFKFEDLVSWAKGKSVDRLIKDAEDRIHQQYANKDRKIIGSVEKSTPAVKVKQAQEQSKGAGMSKWQKDQAKSMFGSTSMTEDEMFEAYLDLNKKKK